MKTLLSLLFLILPLGVQAASPENDFNIDWLNPQAENIHVAIKILAAMTLLTILPGILMATTSFTRIIIVLGLLRQGLGLQSAPSNPILIGMAFFLTCFIMAPTFSEMYTEGVAPYLEESISTEEALAAVKKPMVAFMQSQTKEEDIRLFADSEAEDVAEKLTVLIPAFITSELKAAFQIGILLYIPFLLIDLLVSSILMTMGMMMLSPLVISLPFKLLLFIAADGWHLVFGSLVKSYGL